MRFSSERSLLDTEIIYSCKQRRGKYTQKKGGVALKLKSLHFKPEETDIMSSRTCPTVGPRGGESSSSLGLGTQLTQLELFADLVWILSDPASVNRPRIDHRGIGEPAGSGRPHDEPALRPVAVQHHRVAKQRAGGALVQQCTLRVQVVGVPGWYPEVYPEVQQQHHRFLEGDPSGPRSAHRFRSHALLVGNIQHKTATDQSCTGCDGWPKRRAPQEMKCSSVSGAGRRQGRREERQKRRGIGGHRRSDPGGQECLRL